MHIALYGDLKVDQFSIKRGNTLERKPIYVIQTNDTDDILLY